MLTKEQIIKRLQATRLDRKPKLTPPPKPTATQRAEERFNEARKPTIAVVQDAAAHNRALRERYGENAKQNRCPSFTTNASTTSLGNEPLMHLKLKKSFTPTLVMLVPVIAIGVGDE